MGDWKLALARIIAWSPMWLAAAFILCFGIYQTYQDFGWAGIGALGGIVVISCVIAGAYVGSLVYLQERAIEELEAKRRSQTND